MSAAVEIEHLTKTFRMFANRNRSLKALVLQGRGAKAEEFTALDDISFEVPEGKTFGLLGLNGSGKSTLLKCIARILEPNGGRIRTYGSLAAMLEVGSGFHPDLSGRENIYLNGAILGMRKNEIDRKLDDIIEFSGVREFIDQPVKNYSSGMYVRLGFSVAIHVEPDTLLVDEVLAVGDMPFQERCMDKFAELRRAGRTVIVVSHGLEQMRAFCDEVAWLDHGKLVEVGDARTVIDKYSDLGHSARLDTVHGGSRFGTGGVQITSIKLLSEDVARQTVQTRDEVVIRLQYVASEAVPRPVFGISVETQQGFPVWALQGRDAGFVPERIEAGEGSLDIRIPRLPFRPGTYVVNTSVQDYTSSVNIDIWRGAHTFDVTAPRREAESGGVVVTDAIFENLVPPQLNVVDK